MVTEAQTRIAESLPRQSSGRRSDRPSGANWPHRRARRQARAALALAADMVMNPAFPRRRWSESWPYADQHRRPRTSPTPSPPRCSAKFFVRRCPPAWSPATGVGSRHHPRRRMQFISTTNRAMRSYRRRRRGSVVEGEGRKRSRVGAHADSAGDRVPPRPSRGPRRSIWSTSRTRRSRC
jgi:hypothetical protein